MVGDRHQNVAANTRLQVLGSQTRIIGPQCWLHHVQRGTERLFNRDGKISDTKICCQFLRVTLAMFGGITGRHGDAGYVLWSEGISGDSGNKG